MKNFESIEDQILALKSNLDLIADDVLSVCFDRNYTEETPKFRVKVLVDSTAFKAIYNLSGSKLVENQISFCENGHNSIIDRSLAVTLNGIEYRCVMDMKEYNEFMGCEV